MITSMSPVLFPVAFQSNPSAYDADGFCVRFIFGGQLFYLSADSDLFDDVFDWTVHPGLALILRYPYSSLVYRSITEGF